MPITCARICYMRETSEDDQFWHDRCRDAKTLGFDAVMAADPGRARRMLVDVCNQYGLPLIMDATPPWPETPQAASADLGEQGQDAAGLMDAGYDYLAQCAADGIAGFRCRELAVLPPAHWRALIKSVRSNAPDCRFMAWTPGLAAGQLQQLSDVGFDTAFSSLPWWDGRASWLVDEHARLQGMARAVYMPIADPDAPQGSTGDGPSRGVARLSIRMQAAIVAARGVLVPYDLACRAHREQVVDMNSWIDQRAAMSGQVQMLNGALSPLTVLYRAGMGLLVNPDEHKPAATDWTALLARLPQGRTRLEEVQISTVRSDGPLMQRSSIAAGETALFKAAALEPICRDVLARGKRRAPAVSPALRIAIENVEPTVDSGRFPVKCTAGEALRVQADILMDGHDRLAAQVLWRAADEAGWHEERMAPLGNDRWAATFTPVRIGKYYFTIQAWRDTWGTHREQVEKKHAAGQDVSLDVEEGRQLVAAAHKRAQGRDAGLAATLGELVRHWDLQAMLAPSTANAMSAADPQDCKTTDPVHYPVMADRREAAYASWYELFPRSCGASPNEHGRFRDVIARLPAIRDMGFDVLYFPPIHPIGTSNRKGKNNAVRAQPGDPGSPYAIGSEHGGHTAVHPQLGSLQDFQALLKCARDHDLEIALDFAIQCSPDHPWLAQHPEWFAWRADGSLHYAENPPKRYEDIVNPDFYSRRNGASHQARLWRELRNIVVFWIEQGVRMFRVDNPHTKPLPFWEWMIADIKSDYPDTVFLSEAFTRPKMMYRLAKLGFSQSYTYFTWRNDKQELTAYLSELSSPPASDFFRPNFFVNTPDINPYFLQESGRPGFLIRAALAATMSGLWGLYSGFELCEARAVPHKEEYLDSEKYELRTRDWNQPGNIVAEITRLNQVRRTNPALQTHLGIRFHHVDDGQILFFSKSTRGGDNVVLVIISLNPHQTREGTLDLPLWEWGLPDDARLDLEDMADDRRFSLWGRHHRVALPPERPYLLWRRVQSP